MPSPFPGMNPFFEYPPRWRDFHGSFLVFLRTALLPVVGPRYDVELEVSLHLEKPGDDDGDGRLFAVADAAVVRGGGREPEDGGTATAVAVAAPVVGILSVPDQTPARRLTVRDQQSREVVTVIELLSPSNKKPGLDRDRYLDNRFELIASGTNLIEIDLLRGGRRMPVKGLPPCAYCVMVIPAAESPNVGIWPVGLRDLLPAVPIPLRPDDPVPFVALKPVLDRTYDESGAARRIYGLPPDPPLDPADAAWAKEIADRAASPG